jgi:VanZ family protein
MRNLSTRRTFWQERSSGWPEVLLLLVVLAIVFVTLYPLRGWRVPSQPMLGFLFKPFPRFWTWFDILTNVLAYLPLGAILAYRLRGMLRGRWIVLFALLAGFGLSLLLETTQNLLPTRVPSWLDLLTNTSGSVFGCVFALLVLQRPIGERELIWHRPAALSGESTPTTFLLGFWVLSQLAPQRVFYEAGSMISPLLTWFANLAREPSAGTWTEVALEVGGLLGSLRVDAQYSVWMESFATGLMVTTVGLLLVDVLGAQRRRWLSIALVLLVAYALRVLTHFLLSRNLAFSLEISPASQAGLLLGVLVLCLLQGCRRPTRLLWVAVMLVAEIVLVNLMPDNPYQKQMLTHGISHMSLNSVLTGAKLLAAAWPVVAIVWVLYLWLRHRRQWDGVPFTDRTVVTAHGRFPTPVHHAQ